ncbi:MAG: hypothetical protein DMF60_11400 [Acidobacteria bacterium]|nr:MAG: hypothetical protein DMF60_11400 [Acidobacteriota bacterium]
MMLLSETLSCLASRTISFAVILRIWPPDFYANLQELAHPSVQMFLPRWGAEGSGEDVSREEQGMLADSNFKLLRGVFF